MREAGSFPRCCLRSCPQAGFAAYLHLEEDVVPAGLVELVGIEEECEDVVGVGAVFRQSLRILLRVARRQLGWGRVWGEREVICRQFPCRDNALTTAAQGAMAPQSPASRKRLLEQAWIFDLSTQHNSSEEDLHSTWKRRDILDLLLPQILSSQPPSARGPCSVPHGGPSTFLGFIHPHLTHLQNGASSWLSSHHPPVLQTHLHPQLLCGRGDFAAFACPGCPFPNVA